MSAPAAARVAARCSAVRLAACGYAATSLTQVGVRGEHLRGVPGDAGGHVVEAPQQRGALGEAQRERLGRVDERLVLHVVALGLAVELVGDHVEVGAQQLERGGGDQRRRRARGGSRTAGAPAPAAGSARTGRRPRRRPARPRARSAPRPRRSGGPGRSTRRARCPPRRRCARRRTSSGPSQGGAVSVSTTGTGQARPSNAMQQLRAHGTRPGLVISTSARGLEPASRAMPASCAASSGGADLGTRRARRRAAGRRRRPR